MSYIPWQRRIDQMLSSQGDGTGTIEQNVAGIAITDATTASPTVVTATSHGLSVGDWVFIDGATGTTEINGLREVATVPDANTFTLLDEDGDSVGSAGSFGGTVDMNIAFIIKPPSGVTYYLARLNVAAGDTSAWVVGGMLGVSALTNGILVRLYDGAASAFQNLTPTAVKGWHDWAMLAGSDIVTTIDITNNKIETSVGATFTKSTPDEIRLNGDNGDFLVMYSQDDLDGLSFLQAAVQGYRS